MKHLPLIAVALPLLAPATAQAADYTAFRACVEAVEEAAVTATFHHCTAEIAAPCGAAATAKDAAACMDGKRAEIEAEIGARTTSLAGKTGDEEAEITSALDGNRSSGEASCAMMANQDKTTGVKVGQRAVNGAFCQLVVSGDVLGMLYRMESPE